MGFKVKTLLNITRQPKTPEDKSTFLSIQKAPQAEYNYPQCPCQMRSRLTPMSVKKSHPHIHTHTCCKCPPPHTHTHTRTHICVCAQMHVQRHTQKLAHTQTQRLTHACNTHTHTCTHRYGSS